MKKLNKGKKKKGVKPSYSPIYQRMYDALGNEEIFWEWFWERMLDSKSVEEFEEELAHDSASGILIASFLWGDTQSGIVFWSSLFKTLRKAGK